MLKKCNFFVAHFLCLVLQNSSHMLRRISRRLQRRAAANPPIAAPRPQKHMPIMNAITTRRHDAHVPLICVFVCFRPLFLVADTAAKCTHDRPAALVAQSFIQVCPMSTRADKQSPWASVFPSLVSGTVVAVAFNPIDRALYLYSNPLPSTSCHMHHPFSTTNCSSVKEKRPLFVLENFKCVYIPPSRINSHSQTRSPFQGFAGVAWFRLRAWFRVLGHGLLGV
jgi:hypothetical protein